MTRQELIEAIVSEVMDDTYKPDLRSSTKKMADSVRYRYMTSKKGIPSLKNNLHKELDRLKKKR